MYDEPLYEFYEKFLLLQFGIQNQNINWQHSTRLGPDEIAHYFSMSDESYVLVFEDYGGPALDSTFIAETLNLKSQDIEYISPTSETEHDPMYMVNLPMPYEYCENITGAFTLIKLK